MRVLVLGGDGYLGWPTSMHLSRLGHDVAIVDSLERRRWDEQLHTHSLVPILTLDERVDLWTCLGNSAMATFKGDVTEWQFLVETFSTFRPEAIIHFAEHRSAPLSMLSRDHAVITQSNNLIGTLNILFAMRDHAPESHLIKLGSMGEYGTPNIDIEEGDLTIEYRGRTDTLPYPKQGSSFYHLSKIHDSNNIRFACRTWGLTATDLYQGVVYGVHTEESRVHSGLATRFDYDDVWGTCLNRFCLQAAAGHSMTIYGKGGQTRGFLNLRDTLQCIALTIDHRPRRGEYRVFNQFTEQFSVAELAIRVEAAVRARGGQARMVHLENPRSELEQHYYRAANSKLFALGLRPTPLSDAVIHEILDLATKHVDDVRPELLYPRHDWVHGLHGHEIMSTPH